MSLSVQEYGINLFLAEAYDPTINLVEFLNTIGFDEQQTQTLYANRVEALLSAYIEAIHFRLVTARKDGDRLFHILTKRYSFDGNRSSTLEELGLHWHISRERIRQLQRKAIRRCRSPGTRMYCEIALSQSAILLGFMPKRPGTSVIYNKSYSPNSGHSHQTRIINNTLPHPADIEFVADLIGVVLEKIPEGISCNMISHILAGSKGPVVTALISHYDIRLYGILRPLGFGRVTELVKYTTVSDPKFGVNSGKVYVNRYARKVSRDGDGLHPSI